MKPQDAYGTAPESFTSSVASALRRIKEEGPVKKLNLRLAVCVAAALVLIAGVVYAAVNEWKLFDFYKARYGIDISEEAQGAIKQNDMGQRIEAGGVVFTVQEAIADGRHLYLTAKAELRETDTAYLMGAMDSPADWMVTDGNYEKENRRSYKRAAMEDGKRLITAEAWARAAEHDDNGGFGDSIMLADGSLRIINGVDLPLDPEETVLEIELRVTVYEWLPDETGEDYRPSDFISEILRFTLPVTPAAEQVTIDLGGQPFPGTAALLDRCSFWVTPLSCYYKIEYTVVETEDKLLTAHSRNVLWFELLDEQGEPLPMGLTLSRSTHSDDDVHYTQEGSVRLEKLPETLTIRPDESWGGGSEDVVVLVIPSH